jgi:hypothetical protein
MNSDLTVFLTWAQVILGIIMTLGAGVLLATSTDRHSPRLPKRLLQGLVAWGVLYACTPALSGHPDSAASQAVALLVVCVLVFRCRELSEIIGGAEWWPPNRRAYDSIATSSFVEPDPSLSWRLKVNPLWLLFGNARDGYWGSDKWRAGRDRSLWLAIQWWWRHPAHNLRWHLLGVVDCERAVEGRYELAAFKPGGGLLWCISHVCLFGTWVELPFVSYQSPRIRACAGWRPDGGLSIAVSLSLDGLFDVVEA